MMDLTVAVPVLVAIVEMAKMAGMPSKWGAPLAVAVGAVAFYFLGFGDVAPRIFEGVVAGLTASGVYSGVKAQLRK